MDFPNGFSRGNVDKDAVGVLFLCEVCLFRQTDTSFCTLSIFSKAVKSETKCVVHILALLYSSVSEATDFFFFLACKGPHTPS